MASPKTRALVVLNGALIAVLGAVVLAPSSLAQRGSRARGEYTMVSGRIIGGNANAVYIVDSSNQEMIAVRWNESSKSLDGLGYRDISADAQTQPGR
jgi:hypothetical protein